MIYKVLIADDEMLARYSLKTLISKNFDNITVVAEAENGRQAIEYSSRFNPHIIFMDIKMPGINGLEASKEILKENPDAIIIILSAHDNFSYAQKALNDGVQSYLLKPFQKQEIIDKLQEKIKILENRKASGSVHKDLVPFLEEELTALLIGDNADRAMEIQLLSILDFNVDSGFFVLFHCPEIGENEKPEAIRLFRKKIPCLSSLRTGADLAFFVNAVSINNNISKVHSLIEEYILQVKRLYKCRIKCGIGEIMSNRDKLEQSFHQAYSALKNMDDTRDICYFNESSCPKQKIHPRYPYELEAKILDKLESRDFEVFNEISDEIITWITDQGDPDQVKEFAAVFMNSLLKTAKNMGIDEIRSLSLYPLQDLFKKKHSIDIKHSLRDVIIQLKSTVELKESDSNWWLERAFLYLKKNIYSDISLDIIAEEIKISPQHLSRIFKLKYGKTIGEYITGKRITYAKYLLSNSNLTIKEISRKTGYSDQNYFSRVFKKQTGLTPSVYKESI